MFLGACAGRSFLRHIVSVECIQTSAPVMSGTFGLCEDARAVQVQFVNYPNKPESLPLTTSAVLVSRPDSFGSSSPSYTEIDTTVYSV
jgi:hypothetical protein